MNEFQSWHNDTLGAKTVEALNKNNFQATYAKTCQEAVEKVLALIPADATVGMGGSWTNIEDLSLADLLEKRGHTVYNHNKPGLTPEQVNDYRHKQLGCDVFLSGSNAVTLDGQLVNVDGAGNRVAAMIFGPKKVIIIAGINKITRDVPEAEQRIQLYAAPINNKRLNRPNPCTKTGICMDCQGPTRICNITTILRKKPAGIGEYHIIIVGESLGF
ncbi:MAG: lactate utilization protein [Negativicutes bacterium]|nr:lactate utilization protein [Negativicutes bacterium]